MQRSFAWVMIAILAIMLAPFAGVLGVPASAVQADTAAPTAAADDEIIVITSALQLRVDDPTTPPGITPATWTSASEPGWESGWTVVAGGDFNGDGDDELVAARGSEIKVFDPVVQPGRARVDFSVEPGKRVECQAAEHWGLRCGWQRRVCRNPLHIRWGFSGTPGLV